jgi:hypothetical protein
MMVLYQSSIPAVHLSVLREVGPQECARVQAVLERHRERLLALGGVHRLDIGFKSVGGQVTDELAIRLHVTTKLPLQRLAHEDAAPEEIERIPLDVLVSKPPKNHLARRR